MSTKHIFTIRITPILYFSSTLATSFYSLLLSAGVSVLDSLSSILSSISTISRLLFLRSLYITTLSTST